MGDIEWRQTKPARKPGQQELSRLIASFIPRTEPYNFFNYTEHQIHEMAPTEYLIGYSNELTAIGVAKDLDKLDNQPLTMQFGTLTEHVRRELYPGCTVLVKSYARMIVVKNNTLLKFIGRDATYKDIFFNDRLFANTLATDWAIIQKPKIERSLGCVQDFQMHKHRYDRVYFSGRVLDQEHGLEVNVHNDQWPVYIKKEVPVESAVVLTWAKIEEPHSGCYNRYTDRTLMPAGASSLNLSKVDEVEQMEYWLLWVDTNFKASRNI